MKKILVIFFALILSLSVFGCNDEVDAEDATDVIIEDDVSGDQEEIQTDVIQNEFTFPEGTSIAGVDVSGMLAGEAYDRISEVVKDYSLTLTVNGFEFTFTAEDINLRCKRKAITDYYKELSNGGDVEAPCVLIFDADYISNAVSGKFDRNAYNASISYNTSSGSFVINNESYGSAIDIDTVSNAAEYAVLNLEVAIDVTANVYKITPNINANSDTAKNALSKANEYLNVALTYTFTPDGKESNSVTITKDRIATFIKTDGNLNVYISQAAIESYAAALAEKYSISGEPGKFITTGGYPININVTYAGQNVDTAKLSDDIYNCVANKISGTRAAPYFDKTAADDMSFGGNYVEINMSAQYLWVYKNGECVVSTPIVTGCVFTSHNTPTGIYSVNDKDTGCYLRGADYVSYVNYWVGFIGNSYGLHDATWRDQFGGDIYLYNGSHGCVNIPLGAMGSIYNNVSLGTKVILYGGATNAEPVQQVINGTDTYNVFIDDTPFKLDAKTEYTISQLTYSSSDSNVAVVSPDGEVTIKGVGSAVITVSAPEEDYYTSAEFNVTVNVESACSKGHHIFDEWKQIKAPSCVPGEETRKCKYCEISENKSVAAVDEHIAGDPIITVDSTCTSDGKIEVKCTTCGNILKTDVVPVKEHKFEVGSEFCSNGCGGANPNYVPPETDDGNEGSGDNPQPSGDDGSLEDPELSGENQDADDTTDSEIIDDSNED